MTETPVQPAAAEEAPLLEITGTLTEAIYMRSLRIRMRRRALRLILFYLVFIVLMLLGLGYWVYSAQPADLPGRRGYLPCVLSLLTDNPGLLIAIAAFCVFFAVMYFLIAPRRAQKAFRQRYPEGSGITYSFFDDCLETRIASAAERGLLRTRYADVRKTEETEAYFLLTTAARQTALLQKALMTPEETARVAELLREKCARRA